LNSIRIEMRDSNVDLQGSHGHGKSLKILEK